MGAPTLITVNILMLGTKLKVYAMAAKKGDQRAHTAKLMVSKLAVRLSILRAWLSLSAIINNADTLMIALKKCPDANVLMRPFLPAGGDLFLLLLDGVAIRLKKLTAASIASSLVLLLISSKTGAEPLSRRL